ncbi:arylamine N-acetyltransferase [Opitutus sp. ER46]|uniref:arylamine N-acetyltransferase family protein n=1 Tax=Opitutus sp. ER46 TaxID=2161864 RepID=UPI000D3071FB|nr:arylamine N-acetyltransferase [Opitutus sp. ER46]PTX98992.1 arylamine N-acetyltransferase [Opitutus sp. ER46]
MTQPPYTPDLDAYFARVGYAGPRAPTLAVLHALTFAHATSIPFENLDVLLDRGIDLTPATVERKLVHAGRGGYCFEQNGLLLEVLQALGFAVRPLSARVRWQRPREFTPPRTHLFLRVEIDGTSWLTDVGVGGLSLTSAIPLDDSGRELPTRHEPRRIVREGGRLFHQIRIGSDWQDVCEFTLEEMPPIDREIANWFTSRHPESHMRARLGVALATPSGRLSILNHEFTRRPTGGAPETRLIRDGAELLAMLEEYFGLSFPAGTHFGPPGSPWPR